MNLNFGMIIGISTDDLPDLRWTSVFSECPEIGIKSTIPVETIRSISVPEDKVEFVKRLVQDKDIQVLPINLKDKFYYMDDLAIFFDDDKFQSFNQSKDSKKFSLGELASMAKTRKLDGIKDIFSKLKEAIKNKFKGKDANDKQECRD